MTPMVTRSSMGDGPLRRVIGASMNAGTATGSAYVTVTLDCGHSRTEEMSVSPTLIIAPKWHCRRCGEEEEDTP